MHYRNTILLLQRYLLNGKVFSFLGKIIPQIEVYFDKMHLTLNNAIKLIPKIPREIEKALDKRKKCAMKPSKRVEF